ncbi:MAG TPA: diaminopimelate decarboxylase [Streptosporangiaceae bacterium]
MTQTPVVSAPVQRPAIEMARGPWPATATRSRTGVVSVGGVALREIAAEYGTPAYVLDERDVRDACRAYRAAFPGGEVAYAAKAFLCRAMARWADEEGLAMDVCSAGELSVAASVGFPAGRLILHGNAKTPQDLHAALDYRAGRIVIDCVSEIARLAAEVPYRQPVLLRVTPGVDAHTHAALTTGVEDQKFGVSLAGGAAADAVRRIVAQPALELVGLHCHIGSQITAPDGHVRAARRLAALMAAIRDEHGLVLPQLNLGGGFGVPYTDADTEPDLPGFARAIRAAVTDACAAARLPVPRITVEPGRAIVARAGVTLYRVIAVKRRPAGRVFVAVDGGVSDNPRPALYGASYTFRVAGRPAGHPGPPATIVGRHCEAGDVLARDVPLPADVRPGDLLVAACTGAYHHSMASSYNLVGRPPVIAVIDGRARVLVRRETDADLRRRDVGL